MTRLLSYYGDDFTGSTDVMEALASHGIKTVMFTRQPTEAEFAPFTDYQAVGLAGSSRSQSPNWMNTHLPEAFAWLQRLNARYCHYKVCSTFDSSPAIGNIGRALEIGAAAFDQNMVPLVVGAPQLKRYTFAGHLFAGYQGQTYRIDRHPVMSVHPVTPMHEADVKLHLARQTAWPTSQIELLDVFDADSQKQAGQRLLNLSAPFIVGSSGVEYALMKAMDLQTQSFPALPAVERLMAVSGSVSPTTERQIKYSLQNGFAGLAIDPLELLGESKAQVLRDAVETSIANAKQGRSVVVYTALGPSTDKGQTLLSIKNARQQIGEALGAILKQTLEQTGVARAIIAGGDSSSHALSQLDVVALTTRFPMSATPGSPLCIAHSANSTISGLEIALKGGQVGGDDYFVSLRDGMA
jgi:3-oxoisoapionate kinase